MNGTNKIARYVLLGIEYALIVIGIILACISYFGEEQDIMHAEGISDAARMVYLIPPSILLVLLIGGELGTFILKWKRNWIGYVALFGLFIAVGFNPLANLTQAVNCFSLMPFASWGMIAFLAAFVIAIVSDSLKKKAK